MAELDIALENRYVRDLAWACFSPPILNTPALADDNHNVDNCGLGLTPKRRDWLHALDRDPTPLIAHLKRKQHSRLGLYFEHLWHFFLAQDPDVTFTAHNLAVREQGRTLGEFDCLYFCHHRQRHFHLELAVKYFLGHGSPTADSPSHWHQWLGPNCRDRLDLKVNHMMQKQSRLADQPAARRALSGLGIDQVTAEVEIKGWLFTAAENGLSAPHAFNQARSLCDWLKIGALENHLGKQDWSSLGVLPRLQWLAPAHRDDIERHTPEEFLAALSTHFASSSRPLLVAAFDEQALEQARFFVTADNWPDPGSG